MRIDAWEVISHGKVWPGFGGITSGSDDFSFASINFAWAARKYGVSSHLIEAAAQVNALMPTIVVEKVVDSLNDVGKAVRGSRIAILGMTSKQYGDYPGNSPETELMHQLLKKGAIVTYNDPHTSESPRTLQHLRSSRPLTTEFLSEQDVVTIVNDHAAYDWAWIVSHAALIIDVRNATRHVIEGREKIFRA
jgi:UDP-N-acetyl-D-glucosamine dehydrogenase